MGVLPKIPMFYNVFYTFPEDLAEAPGECAIGGTLSCMSAPYVHSRV